MALLEATGLAVGRGRSPVLGGVNLAVEEGETLAVLGLDGSGKTTLACTLAGLLPLRQGTLVFGGEEVTRVDAAGRVARRLALVPQGARVFADLTVEGNLLVGGWPRREDPGFVQGRMRRCQRYFPALERRWRERAGELPPLEQQMVAVARGLMADPRLLLVDEPSAGLGAEALDLLLEAVQHITAGGVTVVLLDRRVAVLGVADRGVVLRDGRMVYNGPAHELRDAPRMRRGLLAAGQDAAPADRGAH